MNQSEHKSTTKSNKEKAGRKVKSETRVPAKKARQCEHVMINGEFCRNVALRGRPYCYFHLSHVGRRLREAHIHDVARQHHLEEALIPMELPLLEDANSIQLALTQVLNALLRNRVDTKRAGLALYGLQIASSNLANGVDVRTSEDATIAGRYDHFEEDYQLPHNIPDLKTDESEPEEEEPPAAAAPGTTDAAAKKKPPMPVPAMQPARRERAAGPQFLEISPALVERSIAPAAAAGAVGSPPAAAASVRSFVAGGG